MKLNLGCLEDYREGYINIDKVDIGVADEILDLNDGLPYPDNSIEEILCYNVLEHVYDDEKLIAEFRRVLKHRGIVKIKVPHYSNHMTFHLGHHHHYSWYTFRTDYINYRYHKGFRDNLVMIKSHIRLAPDSSKLRKMLLPLELLVNLNDTTRLIYDKFPILSAHEIYVELQVRKEESDSVYDCQH